MNARTWTGTLAPAAATIAAIAAANATGPRTSAAVAASPAASTAAATAQATQSGIDQAYGLGRLVERGLNVAQQIVTRLDSSAEADEALRDVVAVPPTRAAFGGRVQAAETGGVDHELAGFDEALGTLSRVEREGDDHSDAGVAHPDDVVARAECAGQRLRVRALALEADVEGRERAVGQPGLERAWDGPGLRAPVSDLLCERVVASRHVAHQQIGVAGHRLRVCVDGQVAAQVERPLAERGRKRVVERDDGTGRVRGGGN